MAIFFFFLYVRSGVAFLKLKFMLCVDIGKIQKLITLLEQNYLVNINDSDVNLASSTKRYGNIVAHVMARLENVSLYHVSKLNMLC